MESKELLILIVKEIVKNPGKVQVERSVDEMGVFLRLWVAKEDMGMVIGERGFTSNILKSLMRIVGLNNGERISVKIEEPLSSS